MGPSDRFPFGRRSQTGVGTDELLSPVRPRCQAFLLRLPSLTNQPAKRPDVPLCDHHPIRENVCSDYMSINFR